MSASGRRAGVIAPLVNEHCELAENPLWRTQDGCLYWTDITAGVLHRLHVESMRQEVIYRGVAVGGFTFQANGDLLLFRVKDIALLHPGGAVEVLREFEDEGTERFNDVIADPEGRVFAGTIGRTDTSGGLWRMDCDGSMTLVFRGSGCSNGMGFSPDVTKFYWTCSTRRQIRVFDYESATGRISNERLLYQADVDEGIPDGMTVDRSGHLWSARWGGHAVVHHAPDGTVVDRIRFPVGKITSLCFGGPKLDQFFVTSAGGRSGSGTEDGAIFQFFAGVAGSAGFQSKITMQGVFRRSTPLTFTIPPQP